MADEEIVRYRDIMKVGIQQEEGKTLRRFTFHTLFPLFIFTEPLPSFN